MLVDFYWKGFVNGKERILDVTATVTKDKGYLYDKNGDGYPGYVEVNILSAVDDDTGEDFTEEADLEDAIVDKAIRTAI